MFTTAAVIHAIQSSNKKFVKTFIVDPQVAAAVDSVIDLQATCVRSLCDIASESVDMLTKSAEDFAKFSKNTTV
jgi:hypothetical protein